MDESHLEVLMDELMQVMGTRGRLRYDHMNDIIEDSTKRDRSPLNDGIKDRIEVWRTDPGAEEDGSGNEASNALTATEKSNQNRDIFVSHLYINNRWGLYPDSCGKVEEWWISEPPVLEEDDESFLCNRCRHIDFKVILSQRGLKGSGNAERTSLHFEQLYTVFEREHCAFCRMLAKQIRADHDISKIDPESLKVADFYLNILDEGPDTGLMIEVEYNVEILQREPYRFIIHCVNFSSESGRMIPFNGFAILPASVGFEACAAWLTMCEDCHPATHRNTKSKANQLRLIDTEDNCVSKVQLPCRYVCLSYVWGGVKQTTLNSQTKPILEQKNGLQSAFLDLSQTIKDAIIATRKLGIRYLWIDALCNQQDDATDLSSNIANMDAIYGNAVLTIVASTNSNPTQGLPGVSSVPRAKEANYAVIQGMLLAVAMHDYRKPLMELNDSLWNTRAWTFQERYLSQRMLIFTDSEAMFVCPHSVMFEDTQPVEQPYFESKEVAATITTICEEQEIWVDIFRDPTQTSGTKMFSSPRGQKTILGDDSLDPEKMNPSKIEAPTYHFKQIDLKHGNGFVQFEGLSLWEIYTQCVFEYSRRQITSDKDSIAAFTGLSNRIVQGVNAEFLFNLPTFAFTRALLWYPKEPLKRKVDSDGKALFPSWSWTAWKGHCYYRGKGWHNAVYPGPVTVVKWLTQLSREEFIQKHVDRLKPEMLQAALDGDFDFIEEVDAEKLYQMGYQSKGWKVLIEKQKNRHLYLHDEYAETLFDYPVPLPGEDLPSFIHASNAIRFLAYCVSVRVCDMPQTSFVQEPGLLEPYLQLGINDEDASANERRPWQRIIYHGGYRAGFLMLNILFDEIDQQSQSYKLVAISRDALSSIAPPKDPKIYFALGPVEFQYHLSLREMSREDFTQNIPPPDKTATPLKHPVSENGDARWDAGRFENSVFPVYNVLLVRDLGAYCERIGVGKIHWHALHHASAKRELISLR